MRQELRKRTSGFEPSGREFESPRRANLSMTYGDKKMGVLPMKVSDSDNLAYVLKNLTHYRHGAITQESLSTGSD